jgi:hypothetical protein
VGACAHHEKSLPPPLGDPFVENRAAEKRAGSLFRSARYPDAQSLPIGEIPHSAKPLLHRCAFTSAFRRAQKGIEKMTAKKSTGKRSAGKRRRMTKGERAIANAARLAKLLVAAPSEGDGVLAPPKLIKDKRLAPALQFWREHAAQFQKLGTLEQPDRFAFAMLSIFAAEFVMAEDDILARGYSVNVKTVAGSFMPRESPSVGRRDFAAKMILELSRSFGLTKLDRLNLGRAERFSTTSPDLFKPNKAEPPGVASEVAPTDDEAKTLRELLARRLN